MDRFSARTDELASVYWQGYNDAINDVNKYLPTVGNGRNTPTEWDFEEDDVPF